MSDTQLYSFTLQTVENYVHMKPIYCSTHQIFVHINENMYIHTQTECIEIITFAYVSC